jgi:hypothetical protein
LSQINISANAVTNIESYRALEANFPLAIQKLDIESISVNKDIDYKIPSYPILSDDYVINNYLSFPNIKHRGYYLYRIQNNPDLAGGIIVTNTAPLYDLIITNLISFFRL